MGRISVEEAALLTGASPQFIRMGLRQKRLPWGYAVQTSPRRWTYYITRELVEASRAGGESTVPEGGES